METTSVIRFLDQASERVFLRKVGGGYIFVPRLLLEWYAQRWEEEGIGELGN